jgi:acyl-CoA thioesterase FadM
MNLWLRLLIYLVRVRFMGALDVPNGVSRLAFRCLPTDLDTSLHMNNGRYLTLMDLGRLDVMVRSGLWRPLLRHGWTPIASTITIRFRRELRLFQRVDLETRLLAWSGVNVVMEQVFVIASGPRTGEIAARALFKGGLYDRKARAFVPVARLMDELGVSHDSPPHSAEVAAFLAADEALRRPASGQPPAAS